MKMINKTDGKTSTESIGLTEMQINKLNPFNLSEEEYEFAHEKIRDLIIKDRVLYDRAVEVIEKLHLYGLWRGQATCILMVADAISQGEKLR